MEALKAIASILICIVLLAAEAITMGLFSLDRALSEDAIETTLRETMADTDIAGQLVDEALAQSSVGADGYYGEVIKTVMETDAMTGFFTGYLSSVVSAQLSGEPAEEVGEEELLSAFSQGVDEVNSTGVYSITDEEKDALTQTVRAEAPGLMEKVSRQAGGYETVIAEMAEETMGEEMGILYDLQVYMNQNTRMIAMGGCALLCLILIALNWRSRFGFFWCGAVTAAASVIYWGMYLIGAEKIISYMLHSSYFQDAALSMITAGLRDVAVFGSIATLVFMIIFAVFKMADRRKYE